MNSEQTVDSQLNPQPEPPAPQSFFSRLVGVYFSPGETFKEIGLAPVCPLRRFLLVVGGGFFIGGILEELLQRLYRLPSPLIWAVLLGLASSVICDAILRKLEKSQVQFFVRLRQLVAFDLRPLLALALVGAIGSSVLVDRVGVEKFTNQGIEKAVANGQLTQEQADQRLEGMRKAAPYIKASFPLIGFVASIVFVLILAGLAKLVSMMFGIENDFKPLVAVTAYSMLAVGLIGTVLMAILLNVKPVEDIDIRNPIGSNLTALLELAGITLPKFLHYLFTYVDVFYIWRVVLLGIGCAAVSRRMKASTGIAYAAMVAVIFALIGAAWGAIAG